MSAQLAKGLPDPLNPFSAQYNDPIVASIAFQVDKWEKKQRGLQGHLKDKYVIDPRTSPFIGYWDGIISCALIFTAAVTPVEVGFMPIPQNRWFDALFLVNRAIDLIFIIDMTLQFFLMFPPETGDGPNTEPEATGSTTVAASEKQGKWISNHYLIARHYVVSWWFPLDFFSIGVSGFDIFSPEDSAVSSFKAFRAVRVLRLLKLVRLARGSRIFKRWEMRLSINYAVLSIVYICVMLVFVCHLFACIWGLQASFDPLNTWLGAKHYCTPWPVPPQVESNATCREGYRCDAEEGWQCVGPGSQYLASLYWSIATVTSIGYGDIVATPLHESEQLTCVLMMLVGSLLFAYLVGSFCGLAANLSPDIVRFRQDLTDLNKFLTANNIPNQLRYQLREYMHQTLYLRTAETGNRLLSALAHKLRNEVALTINEKWLIKIDLINDECEEGLILELAFALKLSIFPPADSCPLGPLFIVSRGSALFAGRAYVAGSSWGEAEALLTSDRLRFPIPASAISYLFTYSIEGETLRRTMSQAKYPDAAHRLRRRQVQWIVRRGVVRAAEEKLAMRNECFRGRRSFMVGRARQAIVRATKFQEIVVAAHAAKKKGGKQTRSASCLVNSKNNLSSVDGRGNPSNGNYLAMAAKANQQRLAAMSADMHMQLEGSSAPSQINGSSSGGDAGELSSQLTAILNAQKEDSATMRKMMANLEERSINQAAEIRTMQSQLLAFMGDSAAGAAERGAPPAQAGAGGSFLNHLAC